MTDTPDDVLDDEDWATPDELAPDLEDAHHATLDERPIVVSLFAGIGGFDLGFERAGFQTGAVVEWDAACQRVLAQRFPNAARFTDVRSVSGDAIRSALGGRHIDVLVGGWPCQDVSVAGRRAGVAGDRSGLYAEFVRLVEELRPTWVVAENVPGLLSSRDPENPHARAGDDFGLVLGDFTGFRPDTPDGGWRSSGVCVGPRGSLAWRVLDARYFGVAQRRRRVFLVLHPRDRSAPAEVLLEPEGVCWNPAARIPSWALPADAAVDAPVRGRMAGAVGAGEERPAARMTAEEGVVSALTSALGSGGPDAAHAHAGWFVPENPTAVDLRNGRIEDEVAGTLQSHGQSYSLNAGPAILEPKQMGHDEAHGGDDIAPTVTSKWAKGSGGPAGSETPNLVVVGDGGTDVTHPVTASGTDGMGRGVPAVAYGISSDAVDRTGEGAAGDAASRAGLGITEELSPTLRTRPNNSVAYAVAVRGHKGTSHATLGEPEVANALQAGDAEGTLHPLVLSVTGEQTHALTAEGADASEDGTGRGTPLVPYAPDTAATLTSGAHSPGVSAPGRRQEDDENLVAEAFVEGKTGQSTDDVAPTLQATQPGENSARQYAIYRKAKRAQTNADDETWEADDYANTLNTFDGGDTRATELVIEPAIGVHATQTPVSISEGVPTLGATTAGHGVAHKAAVRRLTPMECERLQGFPDGWTLIDDASDSPRYRALGNAVCVNVSEWIACRIMARELTLSE